MELLGLLGRAFVALLDISIFISCIDFLFHVILGFAWWLSPKFRRETKEKEDYKKIGIYIGACFAPVLLLFLAYITLT